MVRWKKGFADEVLSEDESVSFLCDLNSDADIAVTTLNAYEARIAELERDFAALKEELLIYANEARHANAELARVRAESLRVVPVGEACRADELLPDTTFSRGGKVYVITHTYDGSDYVWPMALDGTGVQQIICCAIVHPVRLERWEDEG